jgi:hypothetical protein
VPADQDTNGLTGRELEPAFGTRSLPAPHDLVGVLRENLEAVVLAERQRRGEVYAPEDTYPVIRRIGAISEGLNDYGRAFIKVAKEANGYIQDELEEAVGEQDGIPNSGMRVPDVDGTDLLVELDKRNEYDIDSGIVQSGVLALVMTTNMAAQKLVELAAPDEEPAAELLAELLADAMTTLVACGRFQPQITKVRQMATEMARVDPKVASTITTMLDKARRTDFRGVKVKREQPK